MEHPTIWNPLPAKERERVPDVSYSAATLSRSSTKSLGLGASVALQ